MKFPKSHWKAIFFAVIAIVLWWKLNLWIGESHAAVIGPEFLTKLAVKLFGFAVAYFVTFYGDKLIAPTISEWSDAEDGFAAVWKNNPTDPRLKICSDYYKTLFVGTLIAFSL